MNPRVRAFAVNASSCALSLVEESSQPSSDLRAHGAHTDGTRRKRSPCTRVWERNSRQFAGLRVISQWLQSIVLQYYTAVVARVHGQRTALRGPRRARVGARGTKRTKENQSTNAFSSNVLGIHRRRITLCTIGCAGIVVSPRRCGLEESRSRFISTQRSSRERERERERGRRGRPLSSRIDELKRNLGRASDYRHLAKRSGGRVERERHRSARRKD